MVCSQHDLLVKSETEHKWYHLITVSKPVSQSNFSHYNPLPQEFGQHPGRLPIHWVSAWEWEPSLEDGETWAGFGFLPFFCCSPQGSFHRNATHMLPSSLFPGGAGRQHQPLCSLRRGRGKRKGQSQSPCLLKQRSSEWRKRECGCVLGMSFQRSLPFRQRHLPAPIILV